MTYPSGLSSTTTDQAMHDTACRTAVPRQAIAAAGRVLPGICIAIRTLKVAYRATFSLGWSRVFMAASRPRRSSSPR
jgi:hypothetical protein